MWRLEMSQRNNTIFAWYKSNNLYLENCSPQLVCMYNSLHEQTTFLELFIIIRNYFYY